MHDVLKQLLDLILDIIITSAIVLTVGFIGNATKDILYKKDFEDAQRVEILEYRQLYPYDNKEITGDDIVGLIPRFARIYSFELNINGVIKEFNKDEELIEGDIIWTKDYIRDYLDSNLDKVFVSTLIRNDTNSVIGIRLVRK